jgi:hypothetical protein
LIPILCFIGILLLTVCVLINKDGKRCRYENSLNENEKEVLNYSDKTVAVTAEEEVSIIDSETCNSLVLEKPLVFQHRPILSLKKINESSFSFVITNGPHFGHYYEYDLNGVQLNTNILVNECYVADQVPNELREVAKLKCRTSPDLKVYELLIEDLKKDI